MKKLNIKIQPTKGYLFRDKKAEIQLLVNVCNQLIDKVDELVESNNALCKEIDELKQRDCYETKTSKNH